MATDRPGDDPLHLGGALLFLTGLVALVVLPTAPLVTIGSTTIPLSVAGVALVAVAGVVYVAAWRRGGNRWMLPRAVACFVVLLGSVSVGVARISGIGTLRTVGVGVTAIGAAAFVAVRWVPEAKWEGIVPDPPGGRTAGPPGTAAPGTDAGPEDEIDPGAEDGTGDPDGEAGSRDPDSDPDPDEETGSPGSPVGNGTNEDDGAGDGDADGESSDDDGSGGR